MPLVRVNLQPSRRDLRYFALLALPLLAGLVAAWAIWQGYWTVVWIAAGAAAVVAVMGAIVPQIFRWPYVVWMVLVFPLGWCLSHVLLAITYFLVLTPIGLWLRWRGHDPLRLKPKPGETTNWQEHSTPEDKSRYFRQW